MTYQQKTTLILDDLIQRAENGDGSGSSRDKASAEINRIITTLTDTHKREVVEAERNAVAWTVKIIDEFHSMPHEHSNERDKFYKGVKNGIRDRFRSETGIDPAPNYPIEAQLKSQTKEGEQV